jgi:hypothetical protein
MRSIGNPFSLHENQGLTLNRGSLVFMLEFFSIQVNAMFYMTGYNITLYYPLYI